MTRSNIAPLVDELGQLKAQMADLAIREAALKKTLIDAGIGAYEGDDFRASVSFSEREYLDMDAVRAKLSAQFKRKHTTITPVYSVRVVARNGEGQNDQ